MKQGTDRDAVKEATIEEQAEETSVMIHKYYRSYDFLSAVDKAGLFKFRVDDNSYNLELHGLVLKKLGVCLYGSQLFEDYQSIYW